MNKVVSRAAIASPSLNVRIRAPCGPSFWLVRRKTEANRRPALVGEVRHRQTRHRSARLTVPFRWLD